MQTIRWGIIGAGWIADTIAGDFQLVRNSELTAIASRKLGKAEALARKHRVPKFYGSYMELLEDPDIDVVYIATPHPHHRDIALAAIERGKAVLVEKAFTATHAGAVEVVEAARAKGVFCMEAMWTRFLPAVAAAREVVAWGRIGEVLGVQGDLCAYREYDPNHRLFSHDTAGSHYLVSLLHRADKEILLLPLLLPRANEDEVEDCEDRPVHEDRAHQAIQGGKLKQGKICECICHLSDVFRE